MRINSRIAKLPFIVLYFTLTILVSFNWIRVILFQRNFENFRHSQPWDYYLSKWFADSFGTTQQQYFIIALPVVLIGLFFVLKLVGKLLNLDKKSNIKGDNHIAILAILLVLPGILGLQILFGILLIIAFSIISWLDERKS